MTAGGAHGDSVSVRRASVAAMTAEAGAQRLAAAFRGFDAAFILLFCAPRYDRAALAAALGEALPGQTIIGCTTAGEISDEGYVEGTLTAIAFGAAQFTLTYSLVTGLRDGAIDGASAAALAVRAAMEAAAPGAQRGRRCFGMLLVDGLSRQEEALVSAVAPLLAPAPVFGGSAGDGLAFRETFILADGAFHADAALVALIGTVCPFEVFKIDNFEPTDRKMVVTEADPQRRIVTEINAEPAAPEYARMVGLDAGQLSPFVFASHPVVVRVGGEHHVRAIQKVEDDGSLKFYCAIDEGVVLTVARGLRMAEHLEDALDALCDARGEPDFILGFDCILRRLAAEQRQQSRAVSEILARRGVAGFNTYGEQYRSMHVNQTLTGVALYAPRREDAP